MRIGLIAPGGFHPSGTVEIVPIWLWLAERLARRHEVHVFVLDHLPSPATYTLVGATIHDLGTPAANRPYGFVSRYLSLARAINTAGRFDVLHGLRGTPSGALAAIIGRRTQTPSVVTFDSGELVSDPVIAYGGQRTWRGRLAISTAARLASRVHVTSASMASAARAAGIDATCIPLGIDTARTPARLTPPDAPPWRLLHVGSLNRVKDQSTLLGAIAALSGRLDVAVDIAGVDTLDGAMQRKAAALGIADRVVFHGFVPHDALAVLRARAHLAVQSSRHEAASIAMLEAAAAGIPVVGTRTGYVADWAPDGATAVDIGNAAALAGAIASLVADPAGRERQAAVARRWAVAHDADWSSQEIDALYRDVCLRPST